MHHGSAALTIHGRRTICRRVLEEGWSITRAAWAAGVSRQTASKWLHRFVVEGEAGLHNRSTRPLRSPTRIPTRVVKKIVRARLRLRWGPHRLGWSLRLPRSSVYAVLRRVGLSRRSAMAEATRAPLRMAPARGPHPPGHEEARTYRRGGQALRRSRGRGTDHVHLAIDDHSRLAYAEELPDETGPTATAFTMRAVAFFASHGIEVRRILSDNGSCYCSRIFTDTLEAAGIHAMRTKPYTPRTNGKAEAMVGVLLRGWAYRRPYTTTQERIEALSPFLHTYNHHRPHGGLDGARPIDRVRQ